MFAPRQSSAISETGVSASSFFEGITPAGSGAPTFFRSGYAPPIVHVGIEMENIACLRSLFGEMSTRTNEYLRAAARDGNYITAPSGLKYIPEDHSDAFGHCWIGCRGAQHCGESATAFYGGAHELFREFQGLIGWSEHNSLEEDVHNQEVGRQLAHDNPDGDAFALSYQALVARQLLFHGHDTGTFQRPRVYVCEDIRLEGHLYDAGWHFVPRDFIERF